MDILEMYRGIIYSYHALEREGRQGGSYTHNKVRFGGFDGNYEGKEKISIIQSQLHVAYL